VEPACVPIPSLPPRPHRNDDALSGQRRDLRASGGSMVPSNVNEEDAAFAAAFSDVPLSPAILAEDGRGVVPMLNEVRDRAVLVAGRLEQLVAAGDGLTRVQKLVGRLRDVAVIAIDRSLQPADRATLQRQVDRVLTEIDTVAERTTMDDRLLRPGAETGTGESQPTPYRAIGTATLGIAGLAVRSSDQALAAADALDVATARLERSARTLGSATSRFQDELHGLTSPTTTVTGDLAIGNGTTALNSTMALRAQMGMRSQEAAYAQSGLDVTRVKRLLDLPPWQ
jgi:flagellin